jgi:integrase
VYVRDPQEKRFGQELAVDEKRRFKGRAYSKTFLFEPYKTFFFQHLEQYLERERVQTKEHNYLFQIVERTRRGMPLKDASYAALEKSFKKTVQRAKIAGPAICPDRVWTPHSLRHAYGVYMLNHIEHRQGRGLSLEEVQILMGHKHINSTRHYARTDRLLLEAKLAEDDAKINSFDEGQLYASIMEKLQANSGDAQR